MLPPRPRCSSGACPEPWPCLLWLALPSLRGEHEIKASCSLPWPHVVLGLPWGEGVGWPEGKGAFGVQGG